MRWRWLMLILAALTLAGCAADNSRSDDRDNRYGGFYGGITGGVVP